MGCRASVEKEFHLIPTGDFGGCWDADGNFGAVFDFGVNDLKIKH